MADGLVATGWEARSGPCLSKHADSVTCNTDPSGQQIADPEETQKLIDREGATGQRGREIGGNADRGDKYTNSNKGAKGKRQGSRRGRWDSRPVGELMTIMRKEVSRWRGRPCDKNIRGYQ